jgi:NADH-quinone oxidoreductase subunit A
MMLLAAAFAGVSLVVSNLLSYKRPTPEKLAPYECGIVTEEDAVNRFPVKFYLVAILFVIFDVEIIFLFAWATQFEELGWLGIGAVGVFTLLIVETLSYVWKRGALDWNIARRERYRTGIVESSVEEAA